MTVHEILRAPKMTEADIAELKALRGTGPVPNAFLVRLAEHYLKAEIDGVLNPARHLAAYLDVERQTVLTYMRMARNRSIIARH
ncbi:hypothetical protein [Actinacidiphila glaucinigra]|uniref:Uncharacterized protein n=1 Tax=Actinacidiphila glaucinigra TaxID=235986 RepID=A0A239F0Z6_9ACTN|nr:hypothetical protein [Actinacidiphila glaucinigra]SNS49832.1 hypothetical protein SAMN05216252_106225 [Actinacidiphila glaucinigra]